MLFLFRQALYHSQGQRRRVLALFRSGARGGGGTGGRGRCLTVGALILRIGFRGLLYLNDNKEPPKPYSNFFGPYISHKLQALQDPVGPPFMEPLCSELWVFGV